MAAETPAVSVILIVPGHHASAEDHSRAAPGGAAEDLPGHNGSYKRDVLISLGPRLEELLEAESILHWQLRAAGHELYLEPRARTDHLNHLRIADTIRLRFGVGRALAASPGRSIRDNTEMEFDAERRLGRRRGAARQMSEVCDGS